MATTASELSPLQAYNLLMAFAARHGENTLRLALHAALPQVLRTDLLHLLRLNFVSESLTDLDVEANVLFAPFCQDLGNGYYRFDQNVRLQLLQNLDPAYAEEPTPRSVLIARFLLSYIEQQSRSSDRIQDRLYADYLEVERWGALGFLDPEVAATQLAAALQQATSSSEVAVRIRVAGLATALSTPLARYEKLLAYAAGLEAMETGNFDQAKQLLESLDDAEIEIGKIRLKSPRCVLLERLQAPVETVAEPVEPVTEQDNRSVEQQSSKAARKEIYFSYSHKDLRWADELQKYLTLLLRQGIKVWRDTQQLRDNSDWRTDITEAINRARMAIVLASQAYLTNDYLMTEELPSLIALAEQGELRLAWVCVEPCRWQNTDLAKFQAVNHPSVPLSGLSKRERIGTLIDIAEAINAVFEASDRAEPEMPSATTGDQETRQSPARIYLSTTTSDLREHREAVYRVLKKLEYTVIRPEDAGASASDQRLLDTFRNIAASDLFIAIIGWRYGDIPPKNKISITELEYRQAGTANLPRLMFLADNDAPWPDAFKDEITGEGESGKRIAAFRAEIEREQLVSYFKTPEQLASLVSVAVQRDLINWPNVANTENQRRTFDVFLIHNSKDKPAVRQLARALWERGLKVWLDEEQLVPGQRWQQALEEMIQVTHSAAVLVGKDGLGPWEISEVRAWLLRFVERGLPVIPVLLPGAPDEPKLPLFLRAFNHVDLRNGLTEDGLNRLEWGITGVKPSERAERLRRQDSAKVSTSAAPLHLRVFLASPGDVVNERNLALMVLDELPYDPLLRGRITIETIAWDKPGAGTSMLATMTPQEAIKKGLPTPAQCDIVIVIFWSRMGTPLPPDRKKPDGTQYLSGTEWECLNALEAAVRQGKPQVLVYRCTGKIVLDPDDPEFDEKSRQWRQVKQFFHSFKNPDGSLRYGYNLYSTPDDFREQLNLHLRMLVRKLLEREDSVATIKSERRAPGGYD